MRYLHSFIIAALLVIVSNSIAYAGAITGTTGAPASRYDVTVTKVEVCQDAACTNSFTVGQTTRTFDIASAAVGADVGSYISLKGIPMFKTWTHVRATLSTDFTITANDGTCATNGSGAAGGNRGAWGAGANLAAGAETASVLQLPNEAFVQGALGAGFNYATYGIAQSDDATSFTMTVALSTPYTCIGKLPRIEIKFNTSEAFGHAACTQLFPQPPTITITASDP